MILPSHLFGQVSETRTWEAYPQLALTVAVLPNEAEVRVDTLYDGQSCSAVGDFASDGSTLRTYYETVFVFGGLFTNQSMGNSAQLINAPYDGNFIFGLGYQRFYRRTENFHLGWELGIAGRFGNASTGEIWGGAAIRYDGIVLAHLLKITPSFTAGLSTVTGTMGVEREREISRDGNGTLLFYLGPEIAFSTTANPTTELFLRLHHRSGANGTLGHLREGYNANVIGLRFRY